MHSSESRALSRTETDDDDAEISRESRFAVAHCTPLHQNKAMHKEKVKAIQLGQYLIVARGAAAVAALGELVLQLVQICLQRACIQVLQDSTITGQKHLSLGAMMGRLVLSTRIQVCQECKLTRRQCNYNCCSCTDYELSAWQSLSFMCCCISMLTQVRAATVSNPIAGLCRVCRGHSETSAERWKMWYLQQLCYSGSLSQPVKPDASHILQSHRQRNLQAARACIWHPICLEEHAYVISMTLHLCSRAWSEQIRCCRKQTSLKKPRQLGSELLQCCYTLQVSPSFSHGMLDSCM